jgi:protein-disulfide isomerase
MRRFLAAHRGGHTGGVTQTAVDLDRHVYGAADAPMRVVEYGDFECPYCRAAAPVLRDLVDRSGGAVALVWRHFPIFTLHPFALTAALAAEASGEHFWQMHDELFAHQDALTDVDLAAYAERIGVGAVSGPSAQAFRQAVEADYKSGVELGVRGTPTLFVNGDRYTGRVKLGELRLALGLA